MDHFDAFNRYAEVLGDDLRIDGLVSLAVGVAAGEDGHAAGGVELDVRRLPLADTGAQGTDHRRRRQAAGLDPAGNADPSELAAGLRLGPARGEAVKVDALQAPLQQQRIIA